MDPFSPEPGDLDRRQILKATAWAVPVIVLATAAPARAASNAGNVDASFLTVSSFDLSNLNVLGDGLGPLEYAGAQLGYYSDGGVDPAIVGWTSQLIGPHGEVLESATGTLTIALFATSAAFGHLDYGTAPMEPGTYTARIIVFGSNDTTASAQSQQTLTPA